jgi:hypothetical protein
MSHWHFAAKLAINAVEHGKAGDVVFDMARERSASKD